MTLKAPIALIALSLSLPACGGSIAPTPPPSPEQADDAGLDAEVPEASLLPDVQADASGDACNIPGLPPGMCPPCPSWVPGWDGCAWVDTCTNKCFAPVDASPTCSCTGAEDGGGGGGYVCDGILQDDATSCAVCGKRCDGGK